MKKLKVFILSLIVVLCGMVMTSAITVISYQPSTPSVIRVEQSQSGNNIITTYYYSDGSSNSISIPSGATRYITSITKSNSSSSDKDIFVCTYSDGSSFNFEVDKSFDGKYLTNIIKSSVNGIDYYTVFYSDNTSSIITVPNNTNQIVNTNTPDINSNVNVLTLVQEYCLLNNLSIEDYLNGKLSADYIKTASNKALRSAVSVWCITKYLDTTHITYNQITKRSEATKSISSSAGAGTIYKVDTLANGSYDMDGYAYIITNYHVVYSAYSTDADHMPTIVKVFQYGTQEGVVKTGNTADDGYPEVKFGTGAVDAIVIGGSEEYDLAVLKVKNSDLQKYNSSFRPADIASNYEVADQCIAIGNPDAMGISVTHGIVSVLSENIKLSAVSDNSTMSIRVMRIDAPINSGNSGGGLYNAKGQLIGVVNAKSTTYDEMNYAIPVDNAIKVVDNIIDGYLATNSFYYPKKLIWGVTITQELVSNEYDENNDKHIQTNKIVVTTVNKNAYAEGSLQLGDVIRSITIQHQDLTCETYYINKSYDLPDILFTIRAGDSFAVFGDRGDETNIVLFSNNVVEDDLTTIY